LVCEGISSRSAYPHIVNLQSFGFFKTVAARLANHHCGFDQLQITFDTNAITSLPANVFANGAFLAVWLFFKQCPTEGNLDVCHDASEVRLEILNTIVAVLNIDLVLASPRSELCTVKGTNFGLLDA
jgi:hypothetical protein